MMRAGQLRHRVQFQSFTGADDGFGNTKGAWSTFLTVSAALRETPGRERLAAGRVEAAATATLRVRHDPVTLAVSEKHRVKDHLERIWNIRGIADPSGRGELLEMTLERGGPG